MGIIEALKYLNTELDWKIILILAERGAMNKYSLRSNLNANDRTLRRHLKKLSEKGIILKNYSLSMIDKRKFAYYKLTAAFRFLVATDSLTFTDSSALIYI